MLIFQFTQTVSIALSDMLPVSMNFKKPPGMHSTEAIQTKTIKKEEISCNLIENF